MDDINKPTSAVTDISAETLDKLASRDQDIRNSGVIDIFEQLLPQTPKDYFFKTKDREFVSDGLQVAFDLMGGIPRLAKWAHKNPTYYYKLWAKLLPEAQKHDQGPAIVPVFHNVPASALDMTDIIDTDDTDDE